MTETAYNQPSERRKQAAEEFRSGIGVSELARKHGVSRQRVYQWLRKEKVQFRSYAVKSESLSTQFASEK